MNAILNGHDQALAVFAHELREPLASILLAAQALAETTPAENEPTVLRGLSETIQRQGRYLARLIDGALRAGGRERDHIGLRKEWFNLTQVVQDTVETMAPVMRQRGHRLSVSLPPAPTFLFADALRVQQVLINLLANAAKYTEPGGSVWFTLTETSEEVIVEVRDDGIGVPPALLPRMFGLFEQGDRRASTGYGGLGIGLALVKEVVESHDGQVSAHSDGPGAGSTFVVRFPLWKMEADTADSRRRAPRAGKTSNLTVLATVPNAMADA